MDYKKITIIVSVFNEKDTIVQVLDYLFTLELRIPVEWIVIDDASTDGTLAILKECAARYGFTLFCQPNNQGKGAAIRRGIENATGDIILIQDADFEYSISNIPALVQPILENRADVVYGSRFKSSQCVHRTYHYFANRFLTVLSDLLSGIYLTDMETCYKAIRSDLIKSMNLRSNRFGIEVELTAYIAKTSARIYEIPIDYFPRKRFQGKKITWKDGIAAIWHILYFNLFVSRVDAFNSIPKKYITSRPPISASRAS